ncbi:hypothetical protein BJ944DRAFT_155069 [Cunninghamella echinulata]|nr:hypothetical protein BJ944DRAFT_155069 [Cunninghamella echinulata]
MTFDQLSIVRQDGIVDESIVFRALWQREALERVLFPFKNKQIGMERQAALDEYFDVDGSDSHERRRRILLGVPRYRFSTSVQLTSPMHDNGWKCMNITNDNKKHEESKKRNSTTTNETSSTTSNTTSYQKIYNKTIYSESEYILGHWYRVRVEVQILPKSLMFLQDDSHSTSNNEDSVEKNEEDNNANVIACHSKIRYSIYCLNRHEAVVSYDYIDPEDRVLIPVSEVTESKDSSEPSTGYVGQIVLDERFINNEKNTVDIDMIVVLEIFGITKV